MVIARKLMTDRVPINCTEFKLLEHPQYKFMKFLIDFGGADPETLYVMNTDQDLDITFGEYLKANGVKVETGSPTAEKVYRLQFERFAGNVLLSRAEILSRYRNADITGGKSSSEVCSQITLRGQNGLFAGGIFFCRGEKFEAALKIQSDFLKRLDDGEKKEALQYIPEEYIEAAKKSLFGRTYLIVEPQEGKNSAGGCAISYF